MYQSINPASGEKINEYAQQSDQEMYDTIAAMDQQWQAWKQTDLGLRAERLNRLGQLFTEQAEDLAKLITAEMGKIHSEAVAEINKCALICHYYAKNGADILADQVLDAGYSRSYARYEPMGIILAVMPWNFPFWQAVRFIAPNLMGGNACLLKHAPNVFGCALAIKKVILEAGFPEHLFDCVLIEPNQIALALEDPRVKGITLTGSERAGMAVASKAGQELKKSVLELGGSDPFIVLEDANFEECCKISVKARCSNAGQMCTASKRFIVVEPLYDAFVEKHQQIMESLKIGDPTDPATQIGPMARADLMAELDGQVQRSIKEGARLVTGGYQLEQPGNFYAPTLLADVTGEMTCFKEELFGPVSSLIKAKDEADAVRLANQTPFGLGGSIWSADLKKAEQLALQVNTGMVFINAMTASHPALPFGGVGRSGIGRECASYGIHEFQQVKTVVIA